jgi:hypothetical protein
MSMRTDGGSMRHGWVSLPGEGLTDASPNSKDVTVCRVRDTWSGPNLERHGHWSPSAPNCLDPP